MNALAKEKSPYLLQHAENPVAWQPWGEAAFAKAKAEAKPIFLSIGYSTCHWCHVMAHESFEDAATAKILNDHFIPVKVDREERPDVDRLYMAFVQATTGHGGWPMSVWLTPELKPFYGGTYFAPDARYGRPGFPVLLRRLAELWQTERESILAQSDRVFETLAETLPSDEAGEQGEAPLDLRSAAALGYAAFRSRFDEREGGFGHAPKFPRPAVFDFLFRHAARLRLERGEAPDVAEAREAARMALLTLDRMAAGGMRDHLGGGFHRYSVDTYWHVPHFEKMLYDQAQLAVAYAEAHRLTGGIHHAHAAVLGETLDYLLREMADPVGAFHSAEDADSVPHEEVGKPGAHPMEGAFYVWGAVEIGRLLPPEGAKLFAFVYGVEEDGNAPDGSDPHGEFVGKNILLRRHSLAEAARRFGLSEEEAAARLAAARSVLLEARAKRPLPHRDDKILTAWNGLAISALALGAQVLEEPRYRDAAVRAASFLLGAMKTPEGRLLRAYRQGPGAVEGFAEDYAFLISGLLDLHEATLETRWLKEALALQKTMDALFRDEAGGGYYSSAEGDPTLPLRMKEEYDGAEPAPSSVAAGNLLRFHRLTGDAGFRDRALALFRASRRILERAPEAAPRLLGTLEESLLPPLHLVIVGPPEAESEGTLALLREARRHFIPHRTLLRFLPGEAIPELFGALAPFYSSLRQVDGKPTAFLCEDFACRLPTSDPVVLRNSLEKHSHPLGEVI